MTSSETASNGSLSQLLERAPTLAGTIDLRNPRRVVRALEIAMIQGDRPLPPPVGYPAPVVGLQLAVPAPILEGRIRRRAAEQFAHGLVDEAQALRERFDPELPAFSAIGYREAWAHLDGQLTLEAAIELDAHRNVQFARRQRTWFRTERELAVIDATDGPLPAARSAVAAFLGMLAPS